jgi:Xaa-Pro aminopeptidase
MSRRRPERSGGAAVLVEGLARAKLDALLVTALPNIRYLAGFTGSNGALLVGRNGNTLFTDPRYEIQANAEANCKVRVVRGPLLKAVAATIRARKLRRIGFERNRISYESFDSLSVFAGPATRLIPVTGWIEDLRMLKSAAEIDAIRRSAATNSLAFEAALSRVRIGMSEMDLAAEIDFRMRRAGAESPAFETIVASGARSALPHARPGANPILKDRLLLVDMGANQAGYCSDMTRMAFPGSPPRKIRRMYDAVLEAQMAAVHAVKDGVTAGEVDAAARKVLRSYGLDGAFVHSTGHGLGLEIHESPRLGRGDKTPLRAGMVVTIEPGVYFEGTGGIRIEDTVLVTATGCEILTPTTKDLRVL